MLQKVAIGRINLLKKFWNIRDFGGHPRGFVFFNIYINILLIYLFLFNKLKFINLFYKLIHNYCNLLHIFTSDGGFKLKNNLPLGNSWIIIGIPWGRFLGQMYLKKTSWLLSRKLKMKLIPGYPLISKLPNSSDRYIHSSVNSPTLLTRSNSPLKR